jgi:pyruvate dehydrogenase E2 component (dihydrolipoamide acetyltransferase)
MMIEIVVPQLGEAVSEVTLVQWFKKEGDSVEKDEVLFEVDTDKTLVEVEAFAEGTLVEILAPNGSKVMPLQVVARMTAASEQVSRPEPAVESKISRSVAASSTPKVTPLAQNVADQLGVDLKDVAGTGFSHRVMADDVRSHNLAGDAKETARTPDTGVLKQAATPKARRLAKKLGVDLSGLIGTGADGLISVNDIERAAQAPQTQPAVSTPDFEILLPSKLRQTIATRMQTSKQTVPHFYLMVEADMTQTTALRTYCTDKLGWQRAPTYTDMMVRACALALKSIPQVNKIYTDQGFRPRNTVDIGVAVGIEEGLIVPVLQGVDRLGLQEISAGIRGLTQRARNSRLRQTDLSPKSMVVSNLGMYDIDAFYAIIDIPDPMILAAGRVAERIVALDGRPVVRPLCTLTLSVDHRVLDGMLGAGFLTRVKDILENPYEILGKAK